MRPNNTGIENRKLACDKLYQILCDKKPLENSDARREATQDSRDFGFIKARINLCLRHLGEVDAVLFALLKNPKPLQDSYAFIVLRLAATELLWLPDSAAYAVIHSAVEITKQNPKTKALSGLVNGVLRKITRQTAARAKAEAVAVEINTPPWLWQEWLRDYGEQSAREIATAHLSEAPLDLSFRSRDKLFSAGKKGGGQVCGLQSLRLAEKKRVEEMDGFEDGDFWIQDVAASLPATLLGDINGRAVLEYGAAPGGKSAQLAFAGAKLTALELSSARAKVWHENRTRLDFEGEMIIADGKTYKAPTPFPFILLDAPCSSTGTARRHPDVLWVRTKRQLQNLQREQKALLEAAGENLSAGGVLVYAVCSLQQSEGLELINHYLANCPHMSRKPIEALEIASMSHLLTPEGDIRSLPFHSPNLLQENNETSPAVSASASAPLVCAKGGVDGFFIARLQKA